MRLKNNEIEELLPHRFPFLFVDRIISTNDEEIIGIKSFDDKNEMLKGSFPGSGYIPGMILLESMAQCGGAGIKLLGRVNGTFALTSVVEARFFAGALYKREIKYKIKNLKVSKSIIKQSGKAYMGGLLLMDATWMSIKVI